MRIKGIFIVSVLAAAVLCGCGSVDDNSSSAQESSAAESVAESEAESTAESSAEESEPEADIAAVMTVETSYGGSGIDGQPLGSGDFSEDYEIKAGDVFCETGGGHWYKAKKSFLGKLEKESEYDEVIAEILEVKADGVKVRLGDTEKTLHYGSKQNVSSTFVVCDGINYSHVMTFAEK